MDAHTAEQPAAGWDNEHGEDFPCDVPRGTSPREPVHTNEAMDVDAAEQSPACRDNRDDAHRENSSQDVPRGTRPRGPSRSVRRADELAWMAERVFESGDSPALAPDRHEIVVHVDAEVLASGGAGRCDMEHHTAIAAQTARRLCTALDNLVMLCPVHHRLVHEGGFDVQRLDDGTFRFTAPHGWSVRPPPREASSPDVIVSQN